MSRVGFLSGYPIQRKKSPGIPKVKNPEKISYFRKIPNPGDKNPETKKIPNPGDKNLFIFF